MERKQIDVPFASNQDQRTRIPLTTIGLDERENIFQLLTMNSST